LALALAVDLAVGQAGLARAQDRDRSSSARHRYRPLAYLPPEDPAAVTDRYLNRPPAFDDLQKMMGEGRARRPAGLCRRVARDGGAFSDANIVSDGQGINLGYRVPLITRFDRSLMKGWPWPNLAPRCTGAAGTGCRPWLACRSDRPAVLINPKLPASIWA